MQPGHPVFNRVGRTCPPAPQFPPWSLELRLFLRPVGPTTPKWIDGSPPGDRVIVASRWRKMDAGRAHYGTADRAPDAAHPLRGIRRPEERGRPGDFDGFLAAVDALMEQTKDVTAHHVLVDLSRATIPPLPEALLARALEHLRRRGLGVKNKVDGRRTPTPPTGVRADPGRRRRGGRGVPADAGPQLPRLRRRARLAQRGGAGPLRQIGRVRPGSPPPGSGPGPRTGRAGDAPTTDSDGDVTVDGGGGRRPRRFYVVFHSAKGDFRRGSRPAGLEAHVTGSELVIGIRGLPCEPRGAVFPCTTSSAS